MEKNPDRRRLVSLGEANDVAKRLGESYSSSRYFSIQARGEDEEEENGEQDPEPASDFSARAAQSRWNDQWICSECLKRH